MIGNTGRKQAQRAYKATQCEICGGTMTLQRHHIDHNPTNNEPGNVQILCQTCHKEVHMQTGTWGQNRKLEDKTCPICKTQFRPRKAITTLCGNPACRKEMGRLSAALRWARPDALTA